MQSKVLVQPALGKWLLIALFCIVGVAGARSDNDPPRLVFAHYMVCCPRTVGSAAIDDFRRDVAEAMAVGIDGFALNIGDWSKDPNYQATTAKLFRAAEEAGPRFRLFFSPDYLGPQDAADMVAQYGRHPNYLTVGDRPVLSSFGGDGDWGRATRTEIKKRTGQSIFLVPFYYPSSGREIPTLRDIASLVFNNGDLDGFFAFGAAGPYADLASVIQREASAWGMRDKLFMAGVSPHYRGFRQNYRIFEADGFTAFYEQWKAAIESETRWVELVTWNDWGETSYLAPIDPTSKALLPARQYGNLLTHRGFLELSRYLIAWFKAGKPPAIERDQLFFSYRLHPGGAEGRPDPQLPNTGRPTGANGLRDQVQVVTLLREPGTIVVNVGGMETRKEMPAGYATMAAPLASGSVVVRLERAGRSVGEGTGQLPIGKSGELGNFNIYADFVTLPTQR